MKLATTQKTIRRKAPLADKGASTSKVIRMVKILDHCIPTDAPTMITPVVSLRGFKGVRVDGCSCDVPWAVTLYGGNFYLVHFDGMEDTTLNTPLFVVNYLRANIKRRSRVESFDIDP